MTINIRTATGRRPFDLPSGCGTVSIPEISVVSVCSMPSLTAPLVNPKPIIFNIPQIPIIDRALPCMNIKPKVKVTQKVIQKKKASGKEVTGSFKMQSGVSNCMDNKYVMRLNLTIPCQNLVFNTNTDLLKITKGDSHEPVSCTYQINVMLLGGDMDLTGLVAITARRSGVFVRYKIVHYRNGLIVAVSYRPAGGQRGVVDSMSISGPGQQLAKAEAVRAPDYWRPEKFTMLLAFTACSGKKK